MIDSRMALVLKAAAFAAEKHRDQRRKDRHATPYINHPIALAQILAVEGDVQDAEVIAAAILHDTIEDTNTTEDELRRVFGETIASMVAEVTDDTTADKKTRKNLQIQHAPHLSDGAKLVKLADKIANLRDMAHNPPHDWGTVRRREYFDWAGQVIDGLRGTHAALEARFDEIVREGRP
jgi:guanosine-3',5'-bis(diphosphate) 3'-pyrophosphohydrolase